jgi:prepilin-type N-terminal cleavage/methylation domain-containing protein
MILRLTQANRQTKNSGFTLIEVMIAFLIFTMSVGGLIYGYGQANRMATWSSWSVAAASYASQGLELARSAQWNSQMWPITNGVGTGDELALSPSGVATNGSISYSRVDTLDVPTTGLLINITNYVTVTNISVNPPLRQIRSDVVWWFPLTGRLCTNTMITLRAPDQ